MKPGPETRALADILRREAIDLHWLLLQVALDTPARRPCTGPRCRGAHPVSGPRACMGIRPRVWVALILAGLASWAVLAVAVWLLAGWWTS